MNTETVIMFFGWCSVINIILLTITAVCVIVFRKTVVSIHSKMFKLEEGELTRSYFNYLALYKIIVIVFNIVPWIALKIITGN